MTIQDEARAAADEYARHHIGGMQPVETIGDRVRAAFEAGAVWASGRADREPSAPPLYLALDLWQALGYPVKDFDGYAERNGWGDTWSNLLHAIRVMAGERPCGQDAGGEPCVLLGTGHLVHYGAGDVGTSELLPSRDREPSDAEWSRMIAQVRADAIRSARDGIIPPYNFELRSDGTESPELASYVEIMHEVHDRLSEVADRIEKEAGL